MRGLVQPGAAQLHALSLYPFVHHGWRYFPRLDALAFLIPLPFGFPPAHHAARSVNRGIKRLLTKLALETFQNYRLIAHRPAYESALAWKRRRRSLPYHPELFSTVLFEPCKIVVIVHFFQNRSSQQ